MSRSKVFRGFDLVSMNKKGEVVRTIEVKGTSKKQAIPDAVDTEFTPNLRPIASHLYVVGKVESNRPILYVIPREAIKREHLDVIRRIRFKGNFLSKELPKYRVN